MEIPGTRHGYPETKFRIYYRVRILAQKRQQMQSQYNYAVPGLLQEDRIELS